MRAYSRAHPDHTVTWEQSSDGEHPERQVWVWRAGWLVREESAVTGMVPLDLADQITIVRVLALSTIPRRALAHSVLALLDSLDAARGTS